MHTFSVSLFLVPLPCPTHMTTRSIFLPLWVSTRRLSKDLIRASSILHFPICRCTHRRIQKISLPGLLIKPLERQAWILWIFLFLLALICPLSSYYILIVAYIILYLLRLFCRSFLIVKIQIKFTPRTSFIEWNYNHITINAVIGQYRQIILRTDYGSYNNIKIHKEQNL